MKREQLSTIFIVFNTWVEGSSIVYSKHNWVSESLTHWITHSFCRSHSSMFLSVWWENKSYVYLEKWIYACFPYVYLEKWIHACFPVCTRSMMFVNITYRVPYLFSIIPSLFLVMCHILPGVTSSTRLASCMFTFLHLICAFLCVFVSNSADEFVRNLLDPSYTMTHTTTISNPFASPLSCSTGHAHGSSEIFKGSMNFETCWAQIERVYLESTFDVVCI